MKDLSIEQKAKAYDEALNRAKLLKYNPKKVLFECENIPVSDYIFPELKEDEDELTWLKNYISEEAYYLSMDIRDNKDSIKLQKLQKSLAWLEKQAADKPYYTDLLGYFEIGKRLNHSAEEIIDWLKSKI